LKQQALDLLIRANLVHHELRDHDRSGSALVVAGDYLNTALVFSGIITIALLGLILDACLRGLLLLADPSRRQ
jgi:ABC-type nitrate/sulfonate/bicarbonate transport system permease component